MTAGARVVVDLDDRAVQQALAFGLAWRDLRRARWLAAFGDVLHDDGSPLEAGEVDTLDEVVGSPGRMHEIASGLQVDASTATRAVDRLIARGLVEKARDSDDGRFMRVWATAEGRRVHRALLAKRLRFVTAVLDQFDDADRAALLRLLPDLADAVSFVLRAETIPAKGVP
jgi:DNA-binding MarR family transcriptional regulator